MKKKKYILYGVLIFILVLIISIITISIWNNDFKLTSEDRTWINENINTIQNVYITKDVNIFSKDGEGVFYSFLNNFSEEYGININTVSVDENTNNNGIVLSQTKYLKDNSEVIYTDHYVLVRKQYEIIKDIKDLDGKIIGVLNSDLDYIKSYLKETNINFNGFDKLQQHI